MRVCPFDHDHPDSDWSYDDCVTAYNDAKARGGTMRQHAFVEDDDGLCAKCGKPAAGPPDAHYCCKHRENEPRARMAQRCDCVCHR